MKGYVPCPFEGCRHAFCVKRDNVIKHFIRYHFDDPQFASKQYVLSWLALPKRVRQKHVPKETRFPCIFQGSTLDNERCSGAHVADGYGRHLCAIHQWEGLANFRCTKCDVDFFARDGGEQSLWSAHLHNCKHYEKPVTDTESDEESNEREASPDAADDADEGPSTRRNKRKTSSNAADDVGEGPSSKRNKRRRIQS